MLSANSRLLIFALGAARRSRRLTPGIASHATAYVHGYEPAVEELEAQVGDDLNANGLRFAALLISRRRLEILIVSKSSVTPVRGKGARPVNRRDLCKGRSTTHSVARRVGGRMDRESSGCAGNRRDPTLPSS